MSHFSDGLTWLNEPPHSAVEAGDLVVRSGSKTDFWQGTYYGFHRDNGHFLHQARSGELTAETHVTGHYETLYDQAGLMLRADATHWIKCGIEVTDGSPHLSVVVTNGHSDWSAQRVTLDGEPAGIRLTRLADACFIQFSINQSPWAMARLAYFPPEPAEVQIGLAFCSPEREGFAARFHDFKLGAPAIREIH